MYICVEVKNTYRNILITIVLTGILLTAAQVYFTIQNYKVNKQRFINDVQIALDLSIEKYFSDKARTNIQVYRMDLKEKDSTFQRLRMKKRILPVQLDSALKGLTTEAVDKDQPSISLLWSEAAIDSVFTDSMIIDHHKSGLNQIQIVHDRQVGLSDQFEELTQKVLLSFSEDLLDLGKLYESLGEELNRKNLTIDFALRHFSANRNTNIGVIEEPFLTTSAKSSYLGPNHRVDMDFENATLNILQRGISDLVISVLLVCLVMGVMIHLYHVINKQKQIAEIKDDLISNITHEFKTPIATATSALEGIIHFNRDNDPEKVKRYLAISNEQLTKLNGMVEKLLETATLDQGKQSLDLEEIEVVKWTQAIAERFKMVANEKTISFDSEEDSMMVLIDVFHLENTIANLIDNAIKYGGNQINVRCYRKEDHVFWEVEDNGGQIPKAAHERIFEKLYRIPTGNQHDIKGFGIGLFYARSIAELHGGSLTLEVAPRKTTFRLKL